MKNGKEVYDNIQKELETAGQITLATPTLVEQKAINTG